MWSLLYYISDVKMITDPPAYPGTQRLHLIHDFLIAKSTQTTFFEIHPDGAIRRNRDEINPAGE